MVEAGFLSRNVKSSPAGMECMLMRGRMHLRQGEVQLPGALDADEGIGRTVVVDDVGRRVAAQNPCKYV